MPKYRFVFNLERELTPEELNNLEIALWAQCEDLPIQEPVQLYQVEEKRNEPAKDREV